ncbi:leukocyte receptor cluster member 1-like [Tigriopus californicus]|uniref:leukocyte receptor cluster member 1-like n=1 Tax=Tigriopus californicus TaxID=6832 RepID=UPI0027D9E4B9|nr:leukocyte receptor cluster member 1-like [Tigriopus californicus]
MNILPKKRWHVRTRDNINRVRRDEAKAAEELKKTEERILLAEQEARTTLMRAKARSRLTEEQRTLEAKYEDPAELCGPSASSKALEHVNFFADLEAGETTQNTNKERENEQKAEQEEYEKKVGILTYLGQDSNELTGQRSWWERLPEKRATHVLEETEEKAIELKNSKFKGLLDPLNDIRKYLGCSGVQKYMREKPQVPLSSRPEKKSLKRRRDSSSSSVDSTLSSSSSSSASSSSDRDGKSKSKKAKRPSKRAKKSKTKKHKRDSSKSKKSKKRSSPKSKKKKQKRSKSRKEHKATSEFVSPKTGSSSFEAEDETEFKKQRQLKMNEMEKLRVERLLREKRERARANKLLFADSEEGKQQSTSSSPVDLHTRKEPRKYNSQFNPDAARQNKLDANKKYWLE